MEIGLRLNVEPEAARPVGSEMPHCSQGFINGVLTLTSLPLPGSTPGCKMATLEPPAGTNEQAIPSLGLWTK